MTRFLLLGAGGRECAIGAALTAQPDSALAVLAPTTNPQLRRWAKQYEIGPITDPALAVEAAARAGAECAVIGPEAPLGAGVSDALRRSGVPTVGPSAAAAQVELSKAFMRALLDRHRIDGRLDYGVFTDATEAAAYIRSRGGAVAVKPLGLTGGKGVRVLGDQLPDAEAAVAYAAEVIAQGIGGSNSVLVEELALGQEFTLQVLTDGTTVVPMPAVQDHKRAEEGDVGPNTGGMGSYSDQDHLLPFLRRSERDRALAALEAIVAGLRREGLPYQGILYGQFMLTASGPRIIELNARFGDPEAMNVLSVLRSDFARLCLAIATGRLGDEEVHFERQATVCKYVVPARYPYEGAGGHTLEVDERGVARAGARLYFAGVDERGGALLTTGSRTLGLVGVAPTLQQAEQRASAGLAHVRGQVRWRRDIGTAAAVQARVAHLQALRESAGTP